MKSSFFFVLAITLPSFTDAAWKASFALAAEGGAESPCANEDDIKKMTKVLENVIKKEMGDDAKFVDDLGRRLLEDKTNKNNNEVYPSSPLLRGAPGGVDGASITKQDDRNLQIWGCPPTWYCVLNPNVCYWAGCGWHGGSRFLLEGTSRDRHLDLSVDKAEAASLSKKGTARLHKMQDVTSAECDVETVTFHLEFTS